MSKYRIVGLRSTCFACPAQWEGRTDTGLYIYVRFRWGRLRIGIGQTLDEAIQDPEEEHCWASPYGWDGYMTYDELKTHFTDLVEWPEKEDDEEFQ